MRRREILKAGAVSTALLAGCTRQDGPPPTPQRTTSGPKTEERLTSYAERFESIVDTRSEGFKPGSGETLDAFLDDVAANETMVYLPEGRYRIDGTWNFPSFENFGIVGDGASIAPPEGYADTIFGFGNTDEAEGLLIHGITFDYRAEDTGGRPIIAKVKDNLEIRDVSVVGMQDVEAQMFRFDVTGESGTGVVERLTLPDGAIYESGTYGCFVGNTNRGDITFLDCHIAGFPDNGIYAEPPAGTMRVIGGLFENNDVSNVRVGGGDGGLVRGVHVRCDTAPDEFGNMRGIRLREGNGTVIENCLVELLDAPGSDGAITLASQMNAATIRNTSIRIDKDDVAGILAKHPETIEGDQQLRCENVCIQGSADDAAAILVQYRDGCTFDQVSIHQSGEERDGIQFVGSEGNVLRDSRISVTRDPVVLVDSTLEKTNVWTNVDPENTTLECDSV